MKSVIPFPLAKQPEFKFGKPKAISKFELIIFDEKEWKTQGSTLLQTLGYKNAVDLLKWKPGLVQTLITHAGEGRCVIGFFPEHRETYFVLEFLKKCLAMAFNDSKGELAVVLNFGLATFSHLDFIHALGSAMAVALFNPPVFGKRAKKIETKVLKTLNLSAAFDLNPARAEGAFEVGFCMGQGGTLSSALATLPSNYLNTETYGNEIRLLAKKMGWKLVFHSNRDLKKRGAGGFTAVDQANPESSGGIYELTYRPKRQRLLKRIHFVGKGLCFDTGGYDIKTGEHMVSMKGDMQGSSLALANLWVATQLAMPYEIKAFLAVTENHISPRGFKADDVVTALNGMTIEVINTDAEGRMVLSDTLTMASEGNPDLVMDFATLTGAAVRAMGTKIGVVFSNQEKWHEALRLAGKTSGERVWPFPIDPVYFKKLESKVADTLQCARGSSPDHIVAACFLSQFIKKNTPWVHVDMTPSENEGGIGHLNSNFTGWGVRLTHEFLKMI